MNASAVNTGDVGEMIAKMLSDPESLGKVMNMVSALSASGGAFGDTVKEDTVPPKTEDTYQRDEPHSSLEASASARKSEKICHDRPKISQCDRIRLLEAMRPFLGEDKRAKLDMVIKLLGLAEAAGGFYSFKR